MDFCCHKVSDGGTSTFLMKIFRRITRFMKHTPIELLLSNALIKFMKIRLAKVRFILSVCRHTHTHTHQTSDLFLKFEFLKERKTERERKKNTKKEGKKCVFLCFMKALETTGLCEYKWELYIPKANNLTDQ